MPESSEALRIVQRRTAALGISEVKAVSRLPGAPSYSTVREFLRHGRVTRPQTLRKLEQALGIEPGLLERTDAESRTTGVVQKDDVSSVEAVRVGEDVVHLPTGALSGLSDTERAEVLHYVVAEAFARAAEIRGRRRRQGD